MSSKCLFLSSVSFCRSCSSCLSQSTSSFASASGSSPGLLPAAADASIICFFFRILHQCAHISVCALGSVSPREQQGVRTWKFLTLPCYMVSNCNRPGSKDGNNFILDVKSGDLKPRLLTSQREIMWQVLLIMQHRYQNLVGVEQTTVTNKHWGSNINYSDGIKQYGEAHLRIAASACRFARASSCRRVCSAGNPCWAGLGTTAWPIACSSASTEEGNKAGCSAVQARTTSTHVLKNLRMALAGMEPSFMRARRRDAR